MKKLLFVFVFLILCAKAQAIDYTYEAVAAFHSCQNNGTKCEEMKKYTNDGIKYYSSKQFKNITDLKNYCALLQLRATLQSWGNQEQWQRDMFELNRSCSFGF